MHIYILRHGETKKNRVKIVKKQQSHSDLSCLSASMNQSHDEKVTKITIEDTVDKDSVLNSNGYRQCEKTAEYISQLELDHSVKIYTSPITRTVQSANHIKRIMESKKEIRVEVIEDQRLYDMDENENPDNKIMVLKQFLNEILVEQTKKEPLNHDLVIFVTHNHIIELFYNMTQPLGSVEKKKFHNSSISKLFVDRSSSNGMISRLSGEWDFVDHMDHENDVSGF